MLAFFRINDPFRLVGIFLVILLIRLPFFIGHVPLTVPELEWMVVGESISFKSILYRDVWDDIPPLAALSYAVMETLASRSQWIYQTVALLLLFVQCFLFNRITISSRAYRENTYVPALIYALLMGSFFDFFTLSPVLLSITFILLAVNIIFNHIAVKAREERFLNMGLALGLAALFYLPALIYLPVSILALGFYSSMDLKKYLLMFFGFIFPVVLVGIYFFWHGALMDFLDYYLLSWWSQPTHELVPTRTLLFISLVPAFLLILSWFRIYGAKRYSNQQTNYILIMLLFFAAGCVIIFFVKNKAPYQLMVFVVPAAFFLSHLFLLLKKRLLAEILLISFLATNLLVTYGSLRQFILPGEWVHFQDLVVAPTTWDELVAGKRILVIGEELDAYQNAKLATPYLNWNLSKRHLGQLRSFDNLAVVYNNFSKDLPEVIIDQKGIVSDLFTYMPTIGAHYSQGPLQGAYILRTNN